MIKVLAISALALALVSCGPSEEEVRRVKQQLPEGCELIDLGQYGEIKRLVMVRCENSQTTTTGRWKSGKTHKQYAVTSN